MTLGQNIKRLRSDRGWTLADLSERSGVDVGTIHALEQRNSGRSKFAGALARAFGIGLESLLDDQIGETAGLAIPIPKTADKSGFGLGQKSEEDGISLTSSYLSDSNALQIPLLANAASMGTGNDLLNEDVLLGTLPLQPRWVQEHLRPTSPMNLRFLHAYGDSMSPTFEGGDILLVDTGQIDPKAIDGVYALSANDRLYIKRVRQTLDGRLEVSSDNPKIKTVDELNGNNQVTVHGRVVWVWNGKRL